MTRALIILPVGFEEIEAVTPIDLLHRANVSLTVASLGYPLQVTGRSRVELIADGALDQYIQNTYELIILPGGPGYVNYLTHFGLDQFLKTHAQKKSYLAAICAAPAALYQFGLLQGKRYTCHQSVRNELKDALDEPVVVDGNIVTSTGAGTAFAFGLKLVELMTDKETAQQIAHDMAYSSK